MEHKIYIAAPFFNDKQLSFVKMIENALEVFDLNYFSPRKSGILKNMTKQEREKIAREIYNKNISQMDSSSIMIAFIDDHDPGTMFELGYFTSKKFSSFSENIVITMTAKNYPLNVMLKYGVDAHLIRGSEDLFDLIRYAHQHGWTEACLQFGTDPEVNT